VCGVVNYTDVAFPPWALRRRQHHRSSFVPRPDAILLLHMAILPAHRYARARLLDYLLIVHQAQQASYQALHV
jgi:hypothetical protein